MLKGQGQPLLPEAAKKKPAPRSFDANESWELVDSELFEELRRKLACERGMPAYIKFNDATLRDTAI